MKINNKKNKNSKESTETTLFPSSAGLPKHQIQIRWNEIPPLQPHRRPGANHRLGLWWVCKKRRKQKRGFPSNAKTRFSIPCDFSCLHPSFHCFFSLSTDTHMTRLMITGYHHVGPVLTHKAAVFWIRIYRCFFVACNILLDLLLHSQ